MDNFRKADPTYVEFSPKTAADAIDLFFRHQRMGLSPDLFPETFVHCAKTLPAEEVEKFQEWLINPCGAPRGTELKQVDRENEALRKELLKEAEERDMRDKMQVMKVDEEKSDDWSLNETEDEEKTSVEVEDEKNPVEDEYVTLALLSER